MSGSCQGNSSSDCYYDANCYLFKDCCSDVPSDCEEQGKLLYGTIINNIKVNSIYRPFVVYLYRIH